MKKLALELDRLAVESFETVDDGARARGTVQGQAAPTWPYCTLLERTCLQSNCPCTP